MLTTLEGLRPLRRTVEDKVVRLARNLAFSGLAGLAIRVCEMPLVLALARAVARHGWGLVPLLPLPAPVRAVLTVALMDYTLYVWHVLAHKSPALWRLHRVHHADLDMDASTALRFHFAEHIASVPWRAAQVLVIGVPPHLLLAWQALTLFCILFHHSNVRLPERLEAALALVIVTPRLHGIHHSARTVERESNWSSILTLWDRLHGTYRADPPQEHITIGLAEYRRPADVALAKLVTMPLEPLTP